ncbi:hypothetical protein N9C56_04305 [Paracoccaceae bacterium]|nr:hypothetical protein [Paracoccaceae bacterium]
MLSVQQISEIYELPISTINNRLHQKMTLEDIISKPLAAAKEYKIGEQSFTMGELADFLDMNNSPLHRLLKDGFSPNLLYKISKSLREHGYFICSHCKKKLTAKRQIKSHFHNCTPLIHHNSKWYNFEGENLTIYQLAQKTKINVSTLVDRIGKGKTVSEAVKMGKSQKEFLDYEGKSYSRVAFCREYQIAIKTYYKNYKNMTLTEMIDKFGKAK